MPDNYSPSSFIITSKQKESIFMNMSDGVLFINHNQEITYINPAAKTILGLDNAANADIQNFLLNHTGKTHLNCQNKKNKPFYRLCFNALKHNHKSDNAIVSYDNGEEKKMLNIRISQIKQKEGTDGIMILMEDITSAHNLKRYERDCAMIFAGLITCICVYLFIWSLIRFTLGIRLKTSVYTLIIEVIAFLLFLEIIFFTSMTPKDIGIFVKPSRLLKTFLTSLPIAAAGCCILILLNVILHITKHPIKPYFIGGSFNGAYTYIFTAILQEFLSRGVIQTSVKALMQIKYQKIFSIFLTSLLFSLMHLPFDFPFMMGAFFLSIALGIVYEKQENIWGCVFLHWSCGYLAMAMFF